ncbi:MAG: AAA family ATPase, partial [Bacteroidetes bacterium]|nr:AAA family ATPase [Bacteroidota bacterium]
ETELAAVLDAPLERWRVFLHPTQRRVVQMRANGPVRVLGGAGTGKTVAAMHRVKWLLDNVLGEDERILFTTFTKNLAIDIRENLAKLCSADQLKRVEVVNIHAWVDNFLRANGREFNVHYPGAGDLFWKRALAVKPLQPDLPDSFYRDEWEQVLQPEGITDLASYLNVARTGRGTRLTARDRQSVWTVFEEYRRQLEAAGKRELIDAVREARMLIETLREGQEVFGDGPLVLYRSIVVDEAQDMSAEVFRLLRAMLLPCENDLFIVGDAHQRIYGSRVVLGRCGIEIRGRSRTLRVNYRTTDETCRWAVSLLEGIVFDDLDEGTDDQRGYRSLLHGDPPMVRHFDSFGEETDYIRSLLADIERQGMPLRRVCLVARTKKDRDRYSGALEAQGVPVLTLEAETEDDRSLEGLRVATMHRVKGLEFEHMIIAGMSARNMPAAWMLADAPDAAARERIETMERSLLYVATTRARRQVYITGYGTPSKYLE